MAVGQVAGRDSNQLPEQAELELNQSRRCQTGETRGTGGRCCVHGEREREPVGKSNRSVRGRKEKNKQTVEAIMMNRFRFLENFLQKAAKTMYF